jgi:hypothetical protein
MIRSERVIWFEAFPGPELPPRRPYAGFWPLPDFEEEKLPWTGLLEIACDAGTAWCFRFLVGF